MAETTAGRVTQKDMSQVDLVRHHYNRRALWGTDAVLYRKTHPMEWKSVQGNYQNWEIPAGTPSTTDMESPFGEATKVLYSDDVSVWISRRRESMPFFFRNCDADEVHLISRGQFTYETDFGSIDVNEREFLVIPKGVTHRASVRGAPDTLRMIYESRPEVFLVPVEMVDHVYGKGRPAVDPSRVERPRLPDGALPEGGCEVRVKYSGAFSEFLGDVSTITYDRYPLDTEIIDGEIGIFKFKVMDIEKLGSTPVPFLGGAYLDNAKNLAWTLHLSGGGTSAPVHRDADVDEMRYLSSGPMTGSILFTPQGVDHGAGRGFTKRNRNAPQNPYDIGDTISAYTIKPLKGTPASFAVARPCMC
ncbi:MAG: hypothetical protein GEU73_01200 [Chloroflexi bacterium]|nr:hypothetical protein [Chloroflexota bacterium]